MNTPKTIFIDTSIFDKLAYNFRSRKLEAIRSLGKKLHLRLLIPDPIEREIKRHIAERSVSAVKSLEDAARRAPFLTQLDNWPLKGIEKNNLIYKLQNHIEEELLDFLDNFEVIKLDYDGIDIKRLWIGMLGNISLFLKCFQNWLVALFSWFLVGRVLPLDKHSKK